MEVSQDYLSNLCHELNTTVNAFCFVVDQLEHSELGLNQLKMIQALKGATKSMKGYIHEIGIDKDHVMDVSDLHETVSDPFLLLDELCALFRFQAEKKGIPLYLHYKKSVSRYILADEIKLSHIFMNIISNAIKYTQDGSIHIYLEQCAYSPVKEQLIFTCIDSGKGISKDALSKISERGYREIAAIDSDISGNGIGFSIVQKMVDVMDGSISIQSEIGVGTKIQVIIGFTPVSEKTISDYIYEMKDMDRLKDKRILIVDDNQINILLLKSMLDRNGLKVDECDDGTKAIEKLKECDYDMILLDINMPKISGTKVLYEITCNLKKKIPVVAITADVQQSSFFRYKALGFKDVMVKPIDEIVLMKQLANMLISEQTTGNESADLLSKVEERINEMASGNTSRLEDLKIHLKEELTFAIESIIKAMPVMDWDSAKNILHREKVLLETLDVKEYDFMLESVLNDGIVYPDHEMLMIYQSITQTFRAIVEWANT